MSQPLPVLTGATQPLTPEQRAVLASMDESRQMTPLTLRVQVNEPVDEPLLGAAFAAVVRRHGVLRHVFGQAPGYLGWRQQPRHMEAAVVPCGAFSDADARPWLPDGEMIRLSISRCEDTGATLQLAVHPLVADHGSLCNLARELADACAEPQRAGACDTDEVFQYGQFIEWRQDLEGGEEAHEGQAYWAACLRQRQTHEAPHLAWRHDDPSQADRLAWHATRVLDAGLWARLNTLAATRGLEVRTLIQAAWWSLLSHLSGTECLAGGWRHDGRQDYAVMEGAVGVFDKVLPVFSTWRPESSFIDGAVALEQQLHAHIEAQEYLPLDDAVGTDTAHLAGFSYSRPGPWPHAGWRLADGAVALARANEVFELALHASVDDIGCTLTLSADPCHHTMEAAHTLLDHSVAWLATCVGRPEAPLSALDVADESTRLASASLTGATLDVGFESVLERVIHWARATPQAPAIESRQGCWSYADLLARVDAVAGAMRARGAVPGTLVAVRLPRSADAVVALLAAWRAGAGWLPLEPDWPPARRQAILDDARPVLLIDGLLETLASAPSLTESGPQATDLAYVMYTSGSTGVPKGVMVEHRQLLNYAAAASQTMGLERVRRWALTGTVAADLGHTALFGALYHGACLVVADSADMADGASFSHFLAESAIDGLKMVPSHLEALLDTERPVVPDLVVLGGEAMSPVLAARLFSLNPEVALYNHYGPTETTVGVMIGALRPSAPAWPGGVLPLDTVLANGLMRLLDPGSTAPVPVGKPGELCVGGAQLCRGYLGQKTDEPFVPDPWRPGERLYRTGDLACRLPDGSLRLIGRIDHQFKIRGFRIEPAEIEAALVKLDGVRQAVVLCTPATSSLGDPELRAFVVAQTGVLEDAEAVRAHLLRWLPLHMLPVRLMALDSLPRLANGKVDRPALLALPDPGVTPPEKPRLPETDLEAVLTHGMATLLGRDVVGPDEDFFALGGHSLLVIKLVARVRKQLKLDVAPGMVFDHPTAALLARALQAKATDPAQLDRLAAVQRRLADLSPQERAALEQQARQARQSGAALAGG